MKSKIEPENELDRNQDTGHMEQHRLTHTPLRRHPIRASNTDKPATARGEEEQDGKTT